ncbi:hypothetical protein FRAHR75_360010 [Frankia sp. Hr75.2]|nr:hypothetical protein FRAHR75_360010 [Frankia sp. Hr75.2]
MRLLGYDLDHPVIRTTLETLDAYTVTLPDERARGRPSTRSVGAPGEQGDAQD